MIQGLFVLSVVEYLLGLRGGGKGERFQGHLTDPAQKNEKRNRLLGIVRPLPLLVEAQIEGSYRGFSERESEQAYYAPLLHRRSEVLEKYDELPAIGSSQYN